MPSTFRMRAALAPLVAAALWAACASQVAAQTQNDFFDDTTLQEVRLVISSRDWQTLRAHADEDTYYPADLTWRGVTVRNAGIRSRGSGTRSDVKPSLKVDINRYRSNQQFLGLKGFILKNMLTDASLLRERLTMKMFARMGIPAPREAHARLYVNN
ncbi:MAG: CotH kinase family protein, partial [Acidobacteria bacterium]|nr:CotH kinase family protein [Acidobacteriota bacterium]